MLQLKDWGKEIKALLEEGELTPGNAAGWLDWENEIIHSLQSETDMNQLHRLHDRAKVLLNQMNEQKTERQEVSQYGRHQLPPLPYSYDALEPYINEEIMRLHHDVHHKAYVDGLNEAERMIYLTDLDPGILRHWLREQAFNGSGHILHSIFWTNMTPYSNKLPVKEIRRQIIRDFGSFEDFKRLFTKVASSVEGPGWAALLYDPINKRLVVESIEKHQLNHLVNMIPILVLDVWEHAYYLQYKTGKGDYINQWWNIVNWENVNDRLLQAENIH